MLPADDMSDDGNHCTDQFELVAALLKKQGYSTHALGKVRSACRLPRLVGSAADPRALLIPARRRAAQWDVGFISSSCTPTRSGFDTFLGYYSACISDYWYHWSPDQCDDRGPYIE